MKTRIFGVFAVATFSIVLVNPLQAQQPRQDRTVQEELVELRNTANRAVTLMEQLISQRQEETKLKKLQIAVLALQLRSGSIAEIEKRIQTLQDRLTETEAIAAQMKAEAERIEEMTNDDDTTDGAREHLRAQKKQVDTQIELGSTRVWDLERQILDLQNELVAKKREIDSLEEIVMEGLEGL